VRNPVPVSVVAPGNMDDVPEKLPTIAVGSGEVVYVGVGTTEGVGLGVADADAALVVIFAVFVAAVNMLLAAWLLLVDDVQPDTNKEATTINRTTIAVIGLNCIR
jgi:divalent metal cation (Fe/Co/Zn/Cd) transporter